jgi:hypothetical protein
MLRFATVVAWFYTLFLAWKWSLKNQSLEFVWFSAREVYITIHLVIVANIVTCFGIGVLMLYELWPPNMLYKSAVEQVMMTMLMLVSDTGTCIKGCTRDNWQLLYFCFKLFDATRASSVPSRGWTGYLPEREWPDPTHCIMGENVAWASNNDLSVFLVLEIF